MNQMSSALATAGVKLPSAQQRIWNYVKGHPCVTARRIQQELKITPGSVSSLTSAMVRRGMLRSEKKTLRVLSGSRFINRGVLHFYALGDTYDLKEHPLVTKKKPLMVARAVAPVAVCASAPVKPPAYQVVDSLTVAQARELWQLLDRMFGSAS